MAKLTGGTILLDLSPISISFSGGEVDITNEEVLSQLRELRTYVDPARSFSKSSKDVKPVVIKYRSDDADTDGVIYGCLSFDGTPTDMVISAFFLQAGGVPVTLFINAPFEFVEYKGYVLKEDAVTINTSVGVTHNIVSNVKTLNDAFINELKAGDVVIKKTGTQYHAYIVTFRSATGICLTYHDASCIETQSYDKVNSHWVYNSEDKWSNPEFAPSGTIQDVLGLDSSGKLVKGSVSGGTKLYRHALTGRGYNVVLISTHNTAFTWGTVFGEEGVVTADNQSFDGIVKMCLLQKSTSLGNYIKTYLNIQNVLKIVKDSDDTSIDMNLNFSDSVTEL